MRAYIIIYAVFIFALAAILTTFSTEKTLTFWGTLAVGGFLGALTAGGRR